MAKKMLPLNRLGQLAAFLLDLLFPPRCVFCGEIVAPGAKICRKCAEEVLPSGTVRRISLPVSGTEIPCAYLYSYEGKVRDSILRYKFHGQKENGKYYAQLLAAQVKAVFPQDGFDLVASVPLSETRKRERGYDQAERIAAPLAKSLRLPYAPCLRKVRENRIQHLLPREERARNVHGVYSLTDDAVKGKNILLIDDIVTTGSTLAECAAVLLRAGAASVACAAAAGSEPEKVENR